MDPMDSLIGRTVGPYQILEELGRGGMAVVYKAWQPSLERTIALKVLPEYFRHDPQLVARFQREARAAAHLEHPNIVHIIDTGVADGLPYIAMEYLEGGSLRDRLAQGALAPAAALALVEQIASALDHAHSRGLIHRDVKPANILFTADGRPKVADFGIARVAEGTRLTQTGTLMGTPEYMAPEQAEGQPVDHRADLYALGVLLYQALTGRVPFHSTTPHATLHAVIYEPPPPPRQLNPALPQAVENVVLKALSKRPEARFQRGEDMVSSLRAALARPAPRAPRTQGRRAWVWIAAASVVVALALAVSLTWLLAGGREDNALRPTSTRAVALDTATSGPLASPLVQIPSPSPSLPPTSSPTPVEPSATPVQATPTVPATDTPPPTPTSTPPPPPTPTRTATPVPPPPPSARFGRLAFTSRRDGNPEIYVANLADGGVRRLTANNADDWLPDWSPDGQRLAFTSSRSGGYDLWTMRADGGEQIPLVATSAWDDYPRWAPDGQQLALASTAITQGIPNSEIFVRLADGSLVQRTQTPLEDQWPDWSPDGRIAYGEGSSGGGDWDLYVMNADGSNRSLWLGDPSCDVKPTWSPDGQWIAFVRVPRDTNGSGQVDNEDAGDVWAGHASGGGLRQVTSGAWATTLAWSPDSQWIAFTWVQDSNGNGRTDLQDASAIWAVPLAGGEAVLLVEDAGDPSWTR